MKRECPVCGPKWVSAQAGQLIGEFKALWERALREGWDEREDGRRLSVYHCVVSLKPSHDIRTVEGLQRAYNEVYGYLEDHGALGGMVCVHPYREDGHYDRDGLAIPSVVNGHSHEAECHFHATVMAYWMEPSEADEYPVVGRFFNKGLRWGAIWRTIRYELGHSGIPGPKFHAYRRWGVFDGLESDDEPSEPSDEVDGKVDCPVCGRLMMSACEYAMCVDIPKDAPRADWELDGFGPPDEDYRWNVWEKKEDGTLVELSKVTARMV